MDVEEPRDIHLRYVTYHKPAGVLVILTSNKSFEEVFPDDDTGAIARRVHVVQVPDGFSCYLAPPGAADVESDVD